MSTAYARMGPRLHERLNAWDLQHRHRLVVLLAMLVLPLFGQAATSLDRTRLIMTEREREASPQILNEGTQPVLIQAWVDAGDERAQVDQIQAPFLVDPPVFRLEPGQSRHLRVLMIQADQSLPRDRESVFWFNALEIPPKPNAGDGKNHLQLSFRTRLKVFFRPDSVVQQIAAAANPLNFVLKRNEAGRFSLQVHNPAAVHRSFGSLAVVAPDRAPIQLEAVMLRPGQTMDFVLDVQMRIEDAAARQPPWQVRFSTIDDFGVAREDQKDLLPSSGPASAQE